MTLRPKTIRNARSFGAAFNALLSSVCAVHAVADPQSLTTGVLIFVLVWAAVSSLALAADIVVRRRAGRSYANRDLWRDGGR